MSARLDEENGPFMDTAAIITNVDLVISSDTAVPHLAGALGIPVWLALPQVPDWRWMLGRNDSPWYPTVRVFRQVKRGRWEDVFERMAAEVKLLVAKGGQ
jgi:ADP-heptose:LPS heptosyltransferase